MKVTGFTVAGDVVEIEVNGGIWNLVEHFSMLDGDPVDEPKPIRGQITVYDALADASLPAQEDRCRDERTKTHTN